MKCFIPQSPQDHHKAGITKVRYAPNGSTFASASIDGSIKIYDTVTGKCVNSINKAHGGASVIGLEYSQSSNYLLTTGLDSKGFLWDLGSGKVLCSYLGAVQKFDHAAMVFDYNEDFVIGTDGATQNIIFWDVNTGEIVRKVRGVTENPIRIIAASPTDHGFLTGGDDCRGRYWNLQ
jgi:cleavage stimulation factor subunit 1